MTKSQVYFTDMRCRIGESLLTKLDRLLVQAGIEKINFQNKFTALKIHFGEPGNLAFLRPNFAKTVADRVKALGGRPFLTDCNTLYVGRRKNALDHLETAWENGFSPFSTGCQIIIADGLKGLDDMDVPLPEGLILKSAKIGRAVMDADIIISLNHFKGHEMTGFGGAIKNLGMGSGSIPGKMAMHEDGQPSVSKKLCVGCRVCTKFCDREAISFDKNEKAVINQSRCVGCGHCLGICNQNAIHNHWSTAGPELNRKMAEYALAVVSGRPHFHVNIVNQVSPNCDCYSGNDSPVVPDVGMFAGFDPVALDAASIAAVNEAPALAGSAAGEGAGRPGDHFALVHPKADWRGQLEYAEKIGLGQCAYKLITVS
jgi:uncharacterized Fe-S center protein